MRGWKKNCSGKW